MIGKRLKKLRKQHGDTAVQLSQKLFVTPYTVSSWEQDKSNPGYDLLLKICDLYGCTTDYLLGKSRIQMDSDLTDDEWGGVGAFYGIFEMEEDS